MQTTFFTSKALAKRWNTTNSTLRQWRWNGKGPQFSKFGRLVRYNVEDVEAFEKQHRYVSTSSSPLSLDNPEKVNP